MFVRGLSNHFLEISSLSINFSSDGKIPDVRKAFFPLSLLELLRNSYGVIANSQEFGAGEKFTIREYWFWLCVMEENIKLIN